MSVDGPSELPLHYGSKTSDGELIRRPSTPPGLALPRRSYHPTNGPPHSPELTPVDPYHFSSFDSDTTRVNSGLRRKPTTTTRRYSADHERPNFTVDTSSRRPLRARDEDYYSDRERDRDRSSSSRRDEFSYGHPDQYERSRPPRTYRNTESWEKAPVSATRSYFDEPRYERDLERGRDEYIPERKRSADEQSIDGYNYDAHKQGNRATIDFKNLTKEERAEVMRLPWTQWMDSNVKNRKWFPLYN